MTALPEGIVTFLFTDIEGSTRMLQELGDRYDVVQQEHQRIMREAIASGGGTEIRTEGDSFFAVFESPTRAVHAAVAAQRGLAAAVWPHGEPLRVRMGMHTGEGRVRNGDYLGLDVNRAARISAASHGGQVVMSDATRALIEHDLPEGVAVRDLGQHRLKDLANAERLYDLVVEGLASDFPELKSLEARPNNLPPERSSFIGRRDDVDAVVALVRRHRLVTLTGPGGAGKTRLSLEAARTMLPEFPDGAFFIDLSPITDVELVPSVIALALGLSEQVERRPVDTVREYLRDRSALLVLDNFEQVVEAAGIVEELIGGAPKVRVLVTSRIPLHLYGEQEFAVPPLGLPDTAHLPGLEQVSQYEAVALFIERARAVRSDFVVTNENAPAVAEICVRLDGLPLAIELAAVRIKVLSPDEILSRLGRRLPLLTGGAKNLPERQRTLRNAIAWSHDLLDEGERRFFARLAAFAGGATLDAMEAVCNPDGELGVETLDVVGSLVDKSLLRRTESPHGEARFGMLETIREFAAERLAEAGEDEISRRHARYFQALAERAEAEFVGPDDHVWLDRFEREHDNVRAALRWAISNGEAEIGLILGGSIWRFWFQRGHLREGYAWMEELLQMPNATDHPAALALALTAAGGLAYWRNDLDLTERHYSDALALYRTLDDRIRLAEAISNLAFVPALRFDYDAAIPLFEEALALAREIGHPTRVAETAGSLGYGYLMKRDLDAALPLLEEEVAIAREAGNRFQIADGQAAVGATLFLQGHTERAREVLSEALTMFRDMENVAGVSMVLEAVAGLDGAVGALERAVRLVGAANRIRDTIGGGAPMATHTFDDPIPAARAALGDDAVDRLLQEGSEMDVDKAVAYALERE
ncbi:MAG: adenylate/guanylate cyclase domain-containing protein [Actinomycetota bacterium]